MSAKPNNEPTDEKNATQAGTAVPETSSPEGSGSEDAGSDEWSSGCSSDSMTTTDTTCISETSLVDAEKMFNGILADMARLRMENQKLGDSLAEAKRGEDHAVQKLTEIEDENIKLKKKLNEMEQRGGARLFEIEDESIKLQEKLNEMEQCRESRDFVALKGKFDGLEKQILDILENLERKEQSFEDYQAKMEKLQSESHQQILGLVTDDGYVFREKPLKMIPNGMIQVSRAKVHVSGNHLEDGPLREDKDSRFLYVVRDQYKDFKTFTSLVESVLELGAGHLKFLKGSKSNFLFYNNHDDRIKIDYKWEKEASQKDRVYILSGKTPYNSDMVYYVEE